MVYSPEQSIFPEDRNLQQRNTASPIPNFFQAAQDARNLSRSAAREFYTVVVVCSFLLLAVGLVFGQTIHHTFVNYDDNQYVYENSRIIHAPVAEKVGWAFTSTYAANWHPLTWLSHILDYELYGLYAGGHHATNVLLHAATAILLFLVLKRMTGDLWPSAFVAAVFAIHPLRVESVAWVAERKDVLSGLFFVLTLLAYFGYVRRPFSLVRYLVVMAIFALGLMSKPMLVTLPFILLLLDYWPLGRMHTKPRPSVAPRWGGSCTATPEATVQLSPQPSVKPRPVVAGDGAAADRGLMANVWFLVREKIPLFVLAAAACVATSLAHSPGVVGLNVLPLSARISNALVSYAAYLGQFFYPAGLAVLYPRPVAGLPLWKPVVALLALTAISIAVLAGRRRRPAVLVGWLWYLGMLVPVIGLVQVGDQAMADRYTYLPQIGLGIALAWSATQMVAPWPCRRWVCGVSSALVLAILMASAWRQTTFWRNDEALWTRTVECTSHNAQAHFNLGCAMTGDRRFDEAIAHYRKAVEIEPDYAVAHNNLASVLSHRGRVDEAIAHCRKALEIRPDYADAHFHLASALAAQGRIDEAIAHYQKGLTIQPNDANAHNNLGFIFATRGRLDGAIIEYQKALELLPGYVDAHYNLGVALADGGRLDEAISAYRKALKLKPEFAEAHNNLGNVLAGQGQFDEAIVEYDAARKANPDFPDAYNNLAWLRATSPQASVRNGKEAVELAQRAVKLSGGREPNFLDTLAAAYAEAGRFSEAVETAHTALDLATQQNKHALAESIKTKIPLYKARTPFHKTRNPSPHRPGQP